MSIYRKWQKDQLETMNNKTQQAANDNPLNKFEIAEKWFMNELTIDKAQRLAIDRFGMDALDCGGYQMLELYNLEFNCTPAYSSNVEFKDKLRILKQSILAADVSEQDVLIRDLKKQIDAICNDADTICLAEHPQPEGETEPEFELKSCDNCFQMTNHLNGICQKCKPVNQTASTPEAESEDHAVNIAAMHYAGRYPDNWKCTREIKDGFVAGYKLGKRESKLDEAVELLKDIEKMAKLSMWHESLTGRNVIYGKLVEFLAKHSK